MAAQTTCGSLDTRYVAGLGRCKYGARLRLDLYSAKYYIEDGAYFADGIMLFIGNDDSLGRTCYTCQGACERRDIMAELTRRAWSVRLSDLGHLIQPDSRPEVLMMLAGLVGGAVEHNMVTYPIRAWTADELAEIEKSISSATGASLLLRWWIGSRTLVFPVITMWLKEAFETMPLTATKFTLVPGAHVRTCGSRYANRLITISLCVEGSDVYWKLLMIGRDGYFGLSEDIMGAGCGHGPGNPADMLEALSRPPKITAPGLNIVRRHCAEALMSTAIMTL